MACYNAVKSKPTGVMTFLGRERGRRWTLAMPFFVFAVLAVLGTLVLVGVLHLLARRWL